MKTIKAFAKILFTACGLIAMAAACKVANADMKKVDDLRHYYRDHGLDFFGELIESGSDSDAAPDADTELANERRHAKVELLADDARVRALAQLDALLKTSTGQMTAELLLRKATLLSDRARTASYFQNNTVHTSKVGDTKSYLRQSFQALMRLEREFPSHPKMDVVLFSIAYDYGDLHEPGSKNAYAYYGKLLARFPASPLVGDALLAQAEIDFDARDFSAAIAKLKKIVAAEHPRLKNFALYKLAWTYYNVKDLVSAVASLEKVIDGVNHASGAQRARLELRREALHDLVTFYADRPDADAAANAAAYFEKAARTPDAIAAEYAQTRAKRLASFTAKHVPIPDEETDEYQVSERDDLLLRLAQLYRDQGQHQNAMTVAGSLLERLAGHPRSVALYRLRAESAEKLRRRDQVVVELQRLAAVIEKDLSPIALTSQDLPQTVFRPIDEVLTSTSKASSPAVAAAADAPELEKLSRYQKQLLKGGFDTLNDFAAFLHGEWLKTHDAATAQHALAVYDLGVRTSLAPWRGQNLETALELRRHRAELRLALENWDDAAADFNWLAAHAPAPTKDAKRSSTEASVLTNDVLGEIGALESWLKSPKSPAGTAASHANGAVHPVHQRLLAAYDRYLSLHLNDAQFKQQAAEILVASARLNREYKRNDESLRRLMVYSKRFSDQKDAVGATKDILALLNQSARWQELRDFSDDLLKTAAYKALPVEAEIKRSHEYASLRLLEKFEADKDWDKASSRFAEFARENPDSSFASQALIKSANAALEGAKLSKDPIEAVTRLEAASQASDDGVRLQALLGLEPFYRKGYQWPRLKTLYKNVLALKGQALDAKTRDASQSNLAALEELEASAFAKAGETLITDDRDLPKLLAQIAAFESDTRAYRELRFVKSNNNPARNFKKKTELQTALAARVEKLAGQAPQSLKGAADAWAAIVKSELVVELADTLDTAALPAVLEKAAENDRKSYRDTIAGQSRELRETAKTLAEDAAKQLAQVDSPLPLEDRLNALLESFGARTRLVRHDARAFWSHRPRLAETKDADQDEKEIRKIGKSLLQAEQPKDARELEAHLAAAYIEQNERGYAYAVASALSADTAAGNDDIARQAASLRLSIDLARLSPRLLKAIDSDSLTAQDRWNLARWLAGRRGQLGENDSKWIDESLHDLLRPSAEAPVLQAHAEN